MWEPFGRAPDNSTAYWREGPSGRGTLSILSSCLITLSLCVYTSLHLNIPKHGTAYWPDQILRKAGWVFLGIATPEFVAYIAIRDWLFARNLDVDMARAFELPMSTSTMHKPIEPLEVRTDEIHLATRHGSIDTPTGNLNQSAFPVPESRANSAAQSNNDWQRTAQRKHQWTRTHSYFALMGGFVLETSGMTIRPSLEDIYYEPEWKRGTLSIWALKMIALNMPVVIPDIPSQAILDKSKANGLAKLLVCLQAAWFCVQVIGRLATGGNPISLLELNTFLHAICCLATYIAWFRKPLDIEEPEIIDVSRAENLPFYARLCLGKPIYCSKVGPEEQQSSSLIAALEYDSISPNHPTYPIAFQRGYMFAFSLVDVTPDLEAAMKTLGTNRHHMTLRLYHGQLCFGYRLGIADGVVIHDAYVELNWVDLECLRLAQEQIVTNGIDPVAAPNTYKIPFMDGMAEIEWHEEDPTTMTIDHAPMISSPDETLKRFGKTHAIASNKLWDMFGMDRVLVMGLTSAGAFYGGIHLLAWNGPFNTTKEQWLWRISGIVIANSVLTVPILYLLYACIVRLYSLPRAKTPRFADLTLVTLIVLYVLIYSAARIYLVVECFINLSHLPPEVYNQPAWSRYIPHFSAG